MVNFNLKKLLVITIFTSMSICSFADQSISYFGINSNLVELESLESRKIALKFIDDNLKKQFLISRKLNESDRKWLEESPRTIHQKYKNDPSRSTRAVMDLVSSEKYMILNAHMRIEALRNSIDTHMQCMFDSKNLEDERECLVSLSQNMWWMANSYEEFRILRTKTDVLRGDFSKELNNDAFIYTAYLNATSILKILSKSLASK